MQPLVHIRCADKLVERRLVAVGVVATRRNP